MKNRTTPRYINALDMYLKFPIMSDLLIVFVLITSIRVLNAYDFTSPIDINRLNELCSDLISTSISLAGFVLASLTIIVTFRDKISPNNTNEKSSGSNIFFSSDNYFKLVKLFYRAAIILITIFLILTIVKLTDWFRYNGLQDFIIVGTLLIIVTTVLRSLYLLFQIIKLQNR